MNAPPAAVNLATVQALMAAGRYRDAEQACRSILQRDPRDPNARFLQAVAFAQQGRLDGALPLVEDLLRDFPGMVPALCLRADIHRMSGRFAEALSAYGEALGREFALPGDDSPAARIEALLHLVATAPTARWAGRVEVLQAFGLVLQKAGGAPLDDSAFERIGASPLALTRDDFPQRFGAAAALLGFDLKASPAWTRAMFERVMLPWLHRALEDGAFENALQIETAVYNHYVRQVETEEHFRDCFARWSDAMRAGGQRLARELPPLARKPSAALARVGFFVHNVTALAHVQTLLETLEGHAELPEPLIEPWLFFLGGQPAVVERFRKAGVRIEPLTGRTWNSGFVPALLHLRKRLAEEGIDTLAWISAALTMPFAFAMRLAPRQVWWAMKYHALELPEIDGHVTGGSQTGGTKVIHGREWRVGPVAASGWVDPARAGEAARVRAELGAKGLVYGCFGREEKINSPAFVDAVGEILRRQPDAMFLWTGRHQHPAIQQRLESAGVADRCRFIGWVDTKLYAQVIDVFLDSFPFPCGFTLYEAMAAGKPVVLFDSPESANGGINALVAPLLRAPPESSEEARLAHAIFRPEPGTDLYLRPSSPAQYAELAVKLGEDAAFRKRAGEAARAFVERLMADRRRAARIFIDHLLGRAARPASA